jgi:hypothetical protein
MNVPRRYIPTALSRKDRLIQASQLKKSRKAYKKGNYITRKRVKSFINKKSPHIQNAEKLYKLPKFKLNDKLAKATKCSLKTLKKIFKKGQGAYYSSGSRPNQTPQSWGYARVASSISGGKASAVDYKLLVSGCKKNSKAIKLAKKAIKKYKRGTRKVAKVKLF